MSSRRKHRIVGTAIRTVVVCGLFLTWYVAGWLGLAWLNGRGTVRSRWCDLAQETVYAPISGYLISGYPGAERLEFLRRQCQSTGWQSSHQELKFYFDEIQRPATRETQ